MEKLSKTLFIIGLALAFAGWFFAIMAMAHTAPIYVTVMMAGIWIGALGLLISMAYGGR